MTMLPVVDVAVILPPARAVVIAKRWGRLRLISVPAHQRVANYRRKPVIRNDLVISLALTPVTMAVAPTPNYRINP